VFEVQHHRGNELEIFILRKQMEIKTSRINLVSFILGCTTIMFTLSIGGDLAQASYICPNGAGAGERQIGMTGGGNGVASLPVCEKTNYSGGNGSSYSPEANEVRRNAVTSKALSLYAEYSLEYTRLLNNPKFRDLFRGTWKFSPSEEGLDRTASTSIEHCSATFFKYNKLDTFGFITILGPAGDYQSASLIFWGKGIPRPKNAEKIKVTLTQSNEKPQTVEVMNLSISKESYSNDTFGAIAFAVPTLEAALAGMEDKQSFDVAMNGKTLVKVEWNGGLVARDRLRQCENNRIKLTRVR
jgi:hypothetical protein